MTSLIVAMANNRCIGKAGTIPWRLKADMLRVKELTSGNAIIMGENTFRSLGRALPNRQNIVLSKDPSYAPEGAMLAHSFDEAFALVEKGREPFIFGGGEVYRQALAHSLVDRMYITEVDTEVDGDTFFPEFNKKDWKIIEEESFQKDEENDYDYSFLTLQRYDSV